MNPVRHGGAGVEDDRCLWQKKGVRNCEKQGVHRLNEEKENERLCFEVGLRRFKSRTAQEGAASEAGFAEKSTDNVPRR